MEVLNRGRGWLRFLESPCGLLLAVLLGWVLGYGDNVYVSETARRVGEIFSSILKFLGGPLIGLSIVSLGIRLGSRKWASVGWRVVCWSLLTTVLASALAALLFECFPPPFRPGALYPPVGFRLLTQFFCLSHDDGLWFVRSGNVAGIVLFSLLLGIAFGHVSPKDREVPQKFFDGLLSAILQMTRWMIRGIPLAIVCFVVSIGKELRSQKLGGWGHYLLLVLGSYLLQALVVWPLLLKWNGISPIKSACKAFKTLSFAFFSRSSVATIPAILRCLEVDFRIPPRISRISVPLGATLALSGCAGFIWITVVFVAQSQGIMFTRMDKILWILISAIAAVIHSGMPMGCLLVSTTLLVAIGVPIEPMSLLLPFHGLLDMFEAAVNTWSNICVALVVRESRTLLPAANDG